MSGEYFGRGGCREGAVGTVRVKSVRVHLALESPAAYCLNFIGLYNESFKETIFVSFSFLELLHINKKYIAFFGGNLGGFDPFISRSPHNWIRSSLLWPM